MEWKTRVTELLGCRYPILQGALAGQGTWKFAAAVAQAGAYGVITATTSRTPDRLREDIRKCREATVNAPGSFGVNLTIGVCPRIEEMLEVCIAEGVPVETAAYKPDALAPRIKQAGLKWVHKAARVRDLVHAEQQGADAVIIVGLEGVGFKSPEQLPTLTAVTWAARQIKVPIIASGGIGDGRGFLGALGMGADGIMMGTAFTATKECPMPARSKEAIVRAKPDNLELRYRVLGTADPKAYAEVMKLRGQLPLEKWLPMLERVGPRGLEGAGTEDSGTERAPRLASLAVAVLDHVLTVQELVDSIIRDAETILDSWQFLKTR